MRERLASGERVGQVGMGVCAATEAWEAGEVMVPNRVVMEVTVALVDMVVQEKPVLLH